MRAMIAASACCRKGLGLRVSVLVFTVLSALSAAPSSAAAEKRLALVIGNNIYRNLSGHEQLQNAVSDAEAVKGALESLGFKVDLGENLDRPALVGKISDFGARLGKGDIAFFFYAGHGVSFSGANYILPADIPEPQASGRGEEQRLADLAVAESRVVDRIHDAGAKIAVVVLDACRDNPLAASNNRSVGGERGLAPPPPEPDGLLSIYSAGVGQKAVDDLGDGDPNSLFTRIFVKELKTAGLGLREMAYKTQGEVAKLASANGYNQVPGVYSQIIGDDFYLAGPPALKPTVPALPPAPALALVPTATHVPAPRLATQSKRINALVMLEDGDAEAMSRSVPIYRRVLPELQEILNTHGIQVYDENVAAMHFERPTNRRRSDVELMTIARAINLSEPLDVVVLFQIVASAESNRLVPGIVNPKVRMSARILNVRSGQFIAAFEIDEPHLPPLPNPCDEACLMDEVGSDAKELASDLGSALVEKLAGFNSGGVEGAIKPQLDVSPGAPCDGLSGDFTIRVTDFAPGELLEIERNLRQFRCFEELRPIRAGATFSDYSYRTSAGTAGLDRDLRTMLDTLNLKGQVRYDGSSFVVVKIATRQ